MNISHTELAANKSKFPAMCHLYSIQICSNKCPAYMNEVFRSAENIRINMRHSFLKLKRSFSKNHYQAKGFFLYWTCYLE